MKNSKKECLHEFLKEDIREFKKDAKCVFCHETIEKLQPKIMRHHFVKGVSEEEMQDEAIVSDENNNLLASKSLLFGCFIVALVGIISILYWIYIGIMYVIT